MLDHKTRIKKVDYVHQGLETGAEPLHDGKKLK
jgi:hypothetical protein